MTTTYPERVDLAALKPADTPEYMIDTVHLSGALKQAIRDMDAHLETSEYVALGGLWHSPAGDACAVCLAGALFHRWGVEPDEDTSPVKLEVRNGISCEEREMLINIDRLRYGSVASAVQAHKPETSTLEANRLATAVAASWLMDEDVDYSDEPFLTTVLCEKFAASRDLKLWESRDRERYMRLAAALEDHGL